MRKIEPAYACKKLRALSKGFLGLIFSKIDLFAHLTVIFFILTFLKSIYHLIGP